MDFNSLNYASTSCPAAGTSSIQVMLMMMSAIQNCPLSKNTDYPKNVGKILKNGDSFDFIIIGGGSSGSVLANRLTEISNFKVLVLESGTYPSNMSEIPANWDKLINTYEDWKYYTDQSENYCLGFENQQCFVSRGKVLGGTSTIDVMNFRRGIRSDWNSWAAMGNAGWSFDEMFPYFLKTEDTKNTFFARMNWHGVGGYQTTTPVQPLSHYKLISLASQQNGLVVDEPQFPIGVYESMQMNRDGKRCGAAKSFLTPIKDRSNLFVSLDSHVLKINFNGTRAVGVTVQIDGKRILDLNAEKEVLLTTGAINSPQLLMLSGVGHKDHLESLNIPVVADVPVGDNYHDLLGTMGTIIKLDEMPDIRNTPIGSSNDYVQFYTENKGPLTSSGVSILPHFSTRNSTTTPNVNIVFHNFVKNGNQNGFFEAARINEITKSSIESINQENWLMNAIITILLPKSRGTIRLKSTNPFEKPSIKPNFFEDPDDMEQYIEGIEWLHKLLNTSAMKKLRASLVNINLPACAQHAFNTTDYWKCNVRQLGSSTYHPVGSCKMGPDTDTNSVVDSKLQVRGVTNLRVIDASIIPKTNNGVSTAVNLMIAEKAADLIKVFWGVLTNV